MADVPLKGADGSFYTVPPDALQAELSNGATYATPGEWQAAGEEQRKEKAYGDQPLTAAAEGALRGALPGVGAAIERQFVPQEAMQERAHRNPVPAGVGEFGGVVLGTLATGGLEAPEAAAEVTPLAARLAKAAAINAGYGAGQAVNEAELGDSPLTGQSVLAGAGLGAMLGAGGEGLFMLGERVAPAVVSAASDATDKLGAASKNLFDKFHAWKSGKPLAQIQELSNAAIEGGPAAIGEAALAAEKETAQATNAEQRQSFKEWSKAQKDAAKGASRAQLQEYDDNLTQISGKLATSINDAAEGQEKLLDEVNRHGRPEQIQNLAPSVPPDQAISGAQDMIERTKKTIDQLQGQALLKGQAPLNAASDLLDELDSRIADIKNNGGSMADVHLGLNKYKQDLGTVLYDRDVTGGPAKKAIDALKTSIWPDAKNLLESKAVFGDLGPKTAEWNAAQHDVITDKDDLLSALGMKRKVNGTMQRSVSAAKIESMLMGGSIDHPLGIAGSKAADLQSRIDKYLGSSKRLQDAAANVYKDTSATAPDPEELRSLLDKVTGVRGEAEDTIASHPTGPVQPAFAQGERSDLPNMGLLEKANPEGPASTLKELKGGLGGEVSTLGRIVEGAGGLGLAHAASSVFGGIPGQILTAHAAYQAATNTARNMEALARVAKIVKSVHSTIKSGAAAFVRSGAGRVTRETVEHEAALHVLSGGQQEPKRGASDFAKRSAELDNLTTNPQLMMNTLGRTTSRINDAAPNLTLAANTAAGSIVQYLQQIKPKNPNQPGLVPSDEPWEAPESAVSAYIPIHNLLAKPLTAIDHLRDGTFTTAMAQGLKACLPDLHQHMCDELQRQILDHPRSASKLDYDDRLQLATFFDHPVDFTTSPAFAQAMMAPPPAPPPQPKSAKPSQAGLKNLDFAAADATPAQAVARRAREA